MADSKSNYSTTSNNYIKNIGNKSSIDQSRYNRSKEREKKFNTDWEKNKVNINDVVNKFHTDSNKYIDGVKYIFEGINYSVITDMVAGYLRIKNNKTGKYLKLNGEPGNLSETHFKIKKKEEM